VEQSKRIQECSHRLKLGCFSLIPLVVILIGAEVVLRIFEPDWIACVRTRACPTHDHNPVFLTQQPSNFSLETHEPLFVYHPQYFWWSRPHVTGTFWSTPNVRTNSIGLRDEEQDYTGKERKVLLLGDSVVWGSLVEEEQRFGEVAQELLNDESGYEDVVIVNGGILGFSSFQVSLYLQREALRTIDPAIVVLCMGINDNWPHHRTDAETYERNMDFRNRLRRLLIRSNVFLLCDRYGRELIIWARTGRNPSGLSFIFSQESTDPSVLRNDPFQAEMNLFRAVRAIRRFGAEPVILLEDIRDLQPAGFNALAFRVGRKKFKHFAQNNDVRVLEIKRLQNPPYSLKKNDYLMDFCHLHPRGHVIIGEWLAQTIQEILPPVELP